MRIAARSRPCTFGNAAGIHEFTDSVFMSLVIKPLRNVTASEPLTSSRPREEKSIMPAPPSRMAEYSTDGMALLMINHFRLHCGYAAPQCGRLRLSEGLPDSPGREAQPRGIVTEGRPGKAEPG